MNPVPRGLLASPHCSACPCARNGTPYRPVAACGLGSGFCIVGEGPGCFPAGTPVWTPSGFRDIDLLCEGAAVYNSKGLVDIVRRTFQRDCANGLITLDLLGGQSIRLTAQHQVFAYELLPAPGRGHARRCIGRGSWIEAALLTPQHALYIPWPKAPEAVSAPDLVLSGRIHPKTAQVPDRIPVTPDVAYVLGVYAGDGSYRSGTAVFHLSQGYKEARVLPRLLRVLREAFRVEPTIHRHEKVIEVWANASKIARCLHELLGHDCSVKRVPAFLFRAPHEVRAAFVLGWYETDGNHIRDLARNRKITTVSREGARDLYALLLSCRVFPNLHVERPPRNGKGKRDCYVVGLRNADVRQLGWDLPTHGCKERAIHTTNESGVFVPIRAVRRKRWSGKVYNIETGNHDYLIPFVVHNSEEVLQGYPFIGPSGKVVNKAFQLAGIDRVKTFIANALLCKRPSDEDAPRAVDCCRARLQADLQAARPTAICALGGTAMRALQLPVTAVSEARGTVQYSPLLPGIPVIGTIHPAALLRGGAGEMTKGGKQKMNVDAQAMFLFADIAKAAKVATGEVCAEWSDDIQVVSEASEVQAAMSAILEDVYECGMLGLDLEWVCKDSPNALDALGAGAHRAIITWVGVGCAKRAVSFRWEALRDDYERSTTIAATEIVWTPSGLEALQAAMADENLPKLSHNKQADKAVWEAQVGPARGRYLCSMLLHHVAFPGIDHDLQQVASQFLCVPAWKVAHSRAIAEAKVQQRAEEKQAKAVEREQKKLARVAAHEARNAAKKAEAEARKAQKKVKRAQLLLEGIK